MSNIFVPIYNNSDITKATKEDVGLKAYNLSIAIKNNIKTQKSFVISTESFFYFLDLTKLRERITELLLNLKIDDENEVYKVSEIIQDMILKANIPPVLENAILKAYNGLSGLMRTEVDVIPSIFIPESDKVSSFESILSSFQYIKGGKDILIALKAVWASNYSKDAIMFKYRNQIPQLKPLIGVSVQKSLEHEISIILSPSQDINVLQIEAIFGFAEIIFDNIEAPDIYLYDLNTNRIINKRIAFQSTMYIKGNNKNAKGIKRVEVAKKWRNIQKVEDKKIIEFGNIYKSLKQAMNNDDKLICYITIDNNNVYVTGIESFETNQSNVNKTLSYNVEQNIDNINNSNVNKESREFINDTYSKSTVETENHIIRHVENGTEEYKTSNTRDIYTSFGNNNNNSSVSNINNNESITPHVLLKAEPASFGNITGELRLFNEGENIVNINPNEILVTKKLTPDMIFFIRHAGGIIVEEGGMSSHAAILAREFKIPCIIGATNALRILRNGDTVSMNAKDGLVYSTQDTRQKTVDVYSVNVQEQQRKEEINIPNNLETNTRNNIDKSDNVDVRGYTEESNENEKYIESIVEHDKLPDRENKFSIDNKTLFQAKTATKIYLNAYDPQIATSLLDKESDGIGYLDGTKILNKIIKKHPEDFVDEEKVSIYSNTLADILGVYCKNFTPNQVIYRPSNLISSQLNFENKLKETNPIFGYNGARRYIENPSLLNIELEAIKIVRNKQGHKNLSLLLPMIRDTHDLREIKKIITSSDLKRSSTFKIYLPAETPSTVLLINDLIDIGIDGIYIMANSLSEYLNCMDYSNSKYKNVELFNDTFMRSVEVIVKIAHKEKIPTNIVLENMEFDIEALKELLNWGIMGVSIDPYYMEKTKEIISILEKEIIISKMK